MRAQEIFEDDKLNSPEFHALLTPAVMQLNKAFSDAGFEIRIVGGAVRDLILGKEPKDIDMATTAQPEQAMALLAKLGVQVEPTGLQHGTITAVIDKEPIEITTLRIDKNQDGRHAEVEFTTDWRQDAERRDLTYNAMSLGLDGTLYDYFGGVEDLKNHRTAFVGTADKRIQEDFLRILRYFRFVGRQPQVQWDQDTLDAIQRNAKGLEQISGERIWAEMFKIMGGDHVVEILKTMNALGVLRHCGFNMLNNLDKVATLKANRVGDPRFTLAALLPSVEALAKLRQRWKFDSPSHKLMEFMIQNRRIPLSFDVAIRMITLDKIDKNLVRALFKYRGMMQIAKDLKTWEPPAFPISGNDLIQAGMKPSKDMGQMIANLRKMWLEDGFKMTKDQLLRQALKMKLGQ